MVNYYYKIQNEQMTQIFHSLADPTRRDILERLVMKDLTVSEIAEPYDMSLPAISKHIKILENAKLISRRKCGRECHMHLEKKTLKKGQDYISFFQKRWKSRLDNLSNLLEETELKGGDK